MSTISHYPEDGVAIISRPRPDGDTIPMMSFIDPGLDEEYATATAAFRKEAKARSRADPLAFTALCAACDKEMPRGDAKKCAQCKSVSYCDKECQRKHWKTHKPHCIAPDNGAVALRMAERVVTIDFLMTYLHSCAVLALALHEHPEHVTESVLHLTVDMTPVDLIAQLRALMRGDTPAPGTQRPPEMMTFTVVNARATPLDEVRGVSQRLVDQVRTQQVQGTKVAFVGIYFTAARRGPDGQERSSMAVIPIDPRDFKGIKETPMGVIGGMGDGLEYAKTRENMREAFNNEVRMDKKNHFKLHQMLRPEPEPEAPESTKSEEEEERDDES